MFYFYIKANHCYFYIPAFPMISGPLESSISAAESSAVSCTWLGNLSFDFVEPGNLLFSR